MNKKMVILSYAYCFFPGGAYIFSEDRIEEEEEEEEDDILLFRPDYESRAVHLPDLLRTERGSPPASAAGGTEQDGSAYQGGDTGPVEDLNTIIAR